MKKLEFEKNIIIKSVKFFYFRLKRIIKKINKKIQRNIIKKSEKTLIREIHKNYKKGPTKILINLTRKCNLKCIMCTIHNKDKNQDNIKNYMDLSDELLNKILDFTQNAKRIRFGGSGEPTRDEKFLSRLKKIKKNNPNSKIHLTTNGIIFSNYHKAKKILKNIDTLHISTNGWNNYEKIMINSKLKLIKKSFENISLIKKKDNLKLKINIGFIIMRKNIKDIVSIKKNIQNLNFDKIIYKDIWTPTKTLKKLSMRYDENLKKQAIKELKKANKIEPIQEMFPNNDILKNKFIIKLKNLFKKQKSQLNCLSPWNEVEIVENGKIKFCCFAPTHIGDLKKNSFQEIWNGKVANEYRKQIKNKIIPETCKKCNKFNSIYKN